MISDDKGPKPSAKTIAIGIAIAGLVALAIASGGQSGSTPPSAAVQPLLAQPGTSPVDTHPVGEWVHWKAEDGPRTYRLGGYQLDVAAAVDPDGSAIATAHIVAPDGQSLEYRSGPASWANLAIAADRLEPGRTETQLLLANFSGGAHCCTDLVVIERRADRWKRTELGQRDGETPDLPRDRDGDGRKEFEFVDQSFLYAFESYAGSWAPPVFRHLVDGRIVDISATAAMRPQYEAFAQRSEPVCRAGGNGACAAYVAAAARAGRLDAAWTVMLDSYDQASSWTLPTACRIRTADACPAGAALTFGTFPEALQWHLGEQGYTPKTYVEPAQAAGPSFDCAAARTPGESVVCRSPELTLQDRMLAVAYNRALALSSHRANLRATQRAFVTERNLMTDPETIYGFYQARTDLLLAVD